MIVFLMVAIINNNGCGVATKIFTDQVACERMALEITEIAKKEGYVISARCKETRVE